MSIPTDSVGPTPPSGTSDPVTLKGWFKRISDWIVGLSPAGATVYDTGWVNLTATGVTVVSPVQVRRIGFEVFWRGEVSASWTPSNATVVASGGIPTQFRPADTYRNSGSALGSSGSVNAVATVGTDGALSIRALTAASGAVYLKGLSGYLAG